MRGPIHIDVIFFVSFVFVIIKGLHDRFQILDG